jgi:hypothetical protein
VQPERTAGGGQGDDEDDDENAAIHGPDSNHNRAPIATRARRAQPRGGQGTTIETRCWWAAKAGRRRNMRVSISGRLASICAPPPAVEGAATEEQV